MLKLFKHTKRHSATLAALVIAALIFGDIFLANKAGHTDAAQGHGAAAGVVFLYLAILLLAGKIGGIVERFGQPSVLGELFTGIVLSAAGFFGLSFMFDIQHSGIMAFIAELGAVVLLFQIGLESNVSKMLQVGPSATVVALIGVIAPFALGTFVLGPWLFPHASSVAHLFIGASMVATSVGITASVFQGLKVLKTRASQTVLGAAVIDDILGLVVLAVVSALASGGGVTPAFIAVLTAKAFGFLIAAIILGDILAKTLSRAFSSINPGFGMKLALALTFALSYAYIATLVGLAPIVGAFAAGLILDPVHFDSFELPAIAHQLRRLRGFDDEEKQRIEELIHKHRHAHVEDLIGNIGLMIVPVFFVFTGLQIDFASLLNPQLYVLAAIISVVAIATKVLAGLGARGGATERLLVGTSMVPRGEVGLIFAATGKSLGAIGDNLFSTIILVIIATTFIAPPLIKFLVIKLKEAEDVAGSTAPAFAKTAAHTEG